MKKREIDRDIIKKKVKEIKQIRGDIFEELDQSRVMTDIIYTDLMMYDLGTVARNRNMIQIIDD